MGRAEGSAGITQWEQRPAPALGRETGAFSSSQQAHTRTVAAGCPWAVLGAGTVHWDVREASAVCGRFRFAAPASAFSLARPLGLLLEKPVFLSLSGGSWAVPRPLSLHSQLEDPTSLALPFSWKRKERMGGRKRELLFLKGTDISMQAHLLKCGQLQVRGAEARLSRASPCAGAGSQMHTASGRSVCADSCCHCTLSLCFGLSDPVELVPFLHTWIL